MSQDYNGIFKDSDCISNDVCILNPSLIMAVNQHKGMFSGLKNGNGNIHSGDCSSGLSFNQLNGQTVSQEKTVYLISPKNTVEVDRKKVDSKVFVGGAGLQEHKESDDLREVCISDFDIDDLSENEIPDYCEQPTAEGGLSTSYDKKSVAAPTALVKPTKPCFPGEYTSKPVYRLITLFFVFSFVLFKLVLSSNSL